MVEHRPHAAAAASSGRHRRATRNQPSGNHGGAHDTPGTLINATHLGAETFIPGRELMAGAGRASIGIN